MYAKKKGNMYHQQKPQMLVYIYTINMDPSRDMQYLILNIWEYDLIYHNIQKLSMGVIH